MRGDGDGWVRCDAGHEHWGRHGAAGLLVRAPDRGTSRLLLQHRALWSHDGGTWGIPGGARDSDESVVEAALRETSEETSIDVGRVHVRGRYVVDHGGWSYSTVVADTDAPLDTVVQRESIELRWVPEVEVAGLPLHHAFGRAWPLLTARPTTVVVDVANVLGSRPDGWWKDRAGATTRLLARLAGLQERTVPLPTAGLRSGSAVSGSGDGASVDSRSAVTGSEVGGIAAGPPFAVVRKIVPVVEGAARGAADPDGLTVVRATGSGDDEIVTEVNRSIDVGGGASAQEASGGGHRFGVVVVTADRELRDRLPAGVAVTGPRWLHTLLEASDG